MPSATVTKIFSLVKPFRTIDSLRRIWPDIVELRQGGLIYRQIWEQLPAHYGIECPYATFISACKRIQKGGKRQGVVVKPSSTFAQPVRIQPGGVVNDPFEAAKERARIKREEEQRLNDILDGKDKWSERHQNK